MKLNDIFQYIKKIELKIPIFKDYIIFDHINSKYIINCLNSKSYFIVNFRQKINLFALFYALLFFYRSEIKIEYLYFFLRLSKKKCLITFNYNRLIIYRIKKYYPTIKVNVIQNGSIPNMFSKKIKNNPFKTYVCDLFFFQSSNDKKILKKNKIIANYINCGSVKNNFYKKQKLQTKKKNFLFISQYREIRNTLPFFKNYNYTLDIFFKELKIFCKKNKYSLSILGATKEHLDEYKFYKTKLIDFKFDLIRSAKINSYKIVDNFDVILGVDSTLIYEALSRGKKIGVFNFGRHLSRIYDPTLNDPFLLNDGDVSEVSKLLSSTHGKFWLKQHNKKKINEILKYIAFTSYDKWKNDNFFYINKTLLYDYNNSKVKKYLNEY